MIMKTNIGLYVYRARQKSNPLGKIQYFWNCRKSFRQIYRVYRGGFGPHILQISLQYLVEFQNYDYLNLNVLFQSEQVIKLRFWHKK